MYFMVGWPKRLSFPYKTNESPHLVVADVARSLFVLLCRSQLSVWAARPSILISSYRASGKAVEQFGGYSFAVWRDDSGAVAVSTQHGYVLLFEVKVLGDKDRRVYEAVDHRGSPIRHGSPGVKDNARLSALSLCLAKVLDLQAAITSMVALPSVLVVATADGVLHHVRWDGLTNGTKSLHLCTIPFAMDLQSSRGPVLTGEGAHVRCLEFAPTLTGFAAVLADGRAGFLTAGSGHNTEQVYGVLAQEVSDGTCVAINSKYRLLAFGCASGAVLVYTMDIITGALHLSHTLELTAQDFPDICRRTGGVVFLCWSPDWSVLVVSWERGGLSLWSVFGALLLCTLTGDFGFSADGGRKDPMKFNSMSWGPEGYHLWVLSLRLDGAPCPANPSGGVTAEAKDQEATLHTELMLLQFVKSSIAVNPCMSNQEQVLLQGEDRLYLSCSHLREFANTASQSSSSPGSSVDSAGPVLDSGNLHGASFLLGHKHWHIIQIHNVYLDANWPIRFSVVDGCGQHMAVAGKLGLAHYTLATRKWKLFGNINQEQTMVVTGGLVWWKDFIVATCHNLLENQEELRIYPRSSNLDNAHAHICKLPASALLLNVFQDQLLVFLSDRCVELYAVEQKEEGLGPQACVRPLQRVSLVGCVAHSSLVVSVMLGNMRAEPGLGSRPAMQASVGESLLLNLAGQLVMLQRDRSGPQPLDSENGSRCRKQHAFCSPVVLADCVEALWTTGRPGQVLWDTGGHKEPAESAGPQVLWLGCGQGGMKVWLPLIPGGDIQRLKPCQLEAGKLFHHTLMCRRIMLPFPVVVYPLAVLAGQGLVLGATSETFTSVLPSVLKTGVAVQLPFCLPQRSFQLFLPAVLRELLARNLGEAALGLARGCSNLPYFRHALEMALHAVLEAEAAARTPVPDPLLPALAKLAAEFPGFLRTVAHCARKSEVALWDYLFAAVGSPKELFEESLLARDLETAASYLIILQNMEAPAASRQHATLLFNSALEDGCWELCQHMIRFLRAIGSGEEDTASAVVPSSSEVTVTSGLEFFRNRSISLSQTSELPTPLPVRDGTQGKVILHKALSVPVAPGAKRPRDCGDCVERLFLESMLSRHARRLLEASRIGDLARFSAHLGFELIGWLRSEHERSAQPQDYVCALHQLHRDFCWPLPSAPGLDGNKGAQATHSLPVPWQGESTVRTWWNREPESDRTDGFLPVCALSLSENPEAPIMQEAYLTPICKKDEVSVGSATDMTESSSMLEADWALLDEVLPVPSLSISLQLACRGPAKANVQLRYLHHIFSEAGCIGWCLIIALVLQDLALLRLDIALASHSPVNMLAEQAKGLTAIEKWATQHCSGYKAFFMLIRSDLHFLYSAADALVPHTSPTSMVAGPAVCVDPPPTVEWDTNPVAYRSPNPEMEHLEKLNEEPKKEAKTTVDDYGLEPETYGCHIS
uniref:guanine nucleotide exchange factor subunit RIC1 isoform X2 n=1 Tax=Myxine glutinosa TaxID=7769 RepID=UPI00358EB2C5